MPRRLSRPWSTGTAEWSCAFAARFWVTRRRRRRSASHISRAGARGRSSGHESRSLAGYTVFPTGGREGAAAATPPPASSGRRNHAAGHVVAQTCKCRRITTIGPAAQRARRFPESFRDPLILCYLEGGARNKPRPNCAARWNNSESAITRPGKAEEPVSSERIGLSGMLRGSQAALVKSLPDSGFGPRRRCGWRCSLERERGRLSQDRPCLDRTGRRSFARCDHDQAQGWRG